MNIVASNIGTTTVTLSWTPPFNGNSDIIDYTVEMYLNPTSGVVKRSTTTTAQVVASDLLPDESYVFRVRARNAFSLSSVFSDFTQEIQMNPTGKKELEADVLTFLRVNAGLRGDFSHLWMDFESVIFSYLKANLNANLTRYNK